MTTTLCAAPTRVDWPVRGRFDLARSIGFGFGARPAASGDTLRLAFVLDGYVAQAGVAVTQPAPDLVRFCVVGDVDPERAAAQAARVLSLDEDATGYDRMVDRDPLLRAAYDVRPGLRPPLFHSAYEALVWAVLSARRPAAQMRDVRDRLSRAHGRVLVVAGEPLAALPTPEQLLAVRRFPGVPDVKLRRMHAIAAAALEGRPRHRVVADARRGRGWPPSCAASRGSGRSTPSWSRSARWGTPTYCRRPSPGWWPRRRPGSAATPSPRSTSPRWPRPGARGAPGRASPSAQPPDSRVVRLRCC